MNLLNCFYLYKQQSNQGFIKLESHPDQDLLLLSIFSHLRDQSDLFSVISVCRKWKNIGFDLWKAMPKRPELPNEMWTLILSHLKINELAMAKILNRKANLLCETPWLLKAKESGFTGEENNQKAKKYLKDLFTVIIQLHQKNLIPDVLIQELDSSSLESLLLNGGIQRWPLDVLITILKNKEADNIPNLDLFVRYYYLYSCKVVEKHAMPSHRLKKDANWIDVALKILKNGENVNIPKSKSGTLPLHIAARKGQNGNVRALLCFTRNLNQFNEIGLRAVREATMSDNAQTLSLLIERGLDPNLLWRLTSSFTIRCYA